MKKLPLISNVMKRFFSTREEPHDKPIVGLEETIEIVGSTGKKFSILAKIDTGAFRTSIDRDLAKTMGIDTPIVGERGYRSSLGTERRSLIQATLIIQNTVVSTEISLADRSRLHYPLILGRRDLTDFLIDPSKIGEKLLRG